MKYPITQERIEEACAESLYGTEHPGFCLKCGADHDACEPDAEGYECYECGADAVVGAETALMMGYGT